MFCKSNQIIQKTDQIIKERIVYCAGLVCGHLKSDFFAKAMAWEVGIKPDDLLDISFRVKKSDKTADDYCVTVKGLKDSKEIEVHPLQMNLL